MRPVGVPSITSTHPGLGRPRPEGAAGEIRPVDNREGHQDSQMIKLTCTGPVLCGNPVLLPAFPPLSKSSPRCIWELLYVPC
eukprot:23684-Eustigmatos_ZCMA.PRE.1